MSEDTKFISEYQQHHRYGSEVIQFLSTELLSLMIIFWDFFFSSRWSANMKSNMRELSRKRCPLDNSCVLCVPKDLGCLLGIPATLRPTLPPTPPPWDRS